MSSRIIQRRDNHDNHNRIRFGNCLLHYREIHGEAFSTDWRIIGLPLGFGFLGASYAFSAVANLQLSDFSYGWWVQLFFRAFSFLFLAVTYYFSKSATRHDLIWNITLGVLVAVLAVLILLATISPQQLGPTYQLAQVYVRVFNVVCLSYIVIHVLRSHVRHPDPTTLLIPFGYIFIGLGQFLQIVWAVDRSTLAFWTGLAFRLVGLSVFLLVSYKTFYNSEEGD